jgi:hypothetical protein
MNGLPLLLAIIGHLVGDYLLQNDWMALNKKRDSLPCLVHCMLWTASVCLFAGWMPANSYGALHAQPVLFATHFLQDRTQIVAWWMDRIGQKQFRTGPCAPWSIIVVDNVWHIVTIVLVWRWLA